MTTDPPHGLRVYPLDQRKLSAEEIAVTFAMTSRRPESFDKISQQVTEEKAADFHERWVLNYGHASVAEHAILHMAVEGVSRLACDSLEDNRLASYTEKSSRYQIIGTGSYHIPDEIDHQPSLRKQYITACQHLFHLYSLTTEHLRNYLGTVRERRDGEREGAYNLRLRREATDTTRFILPTATLTNVGVTLNARTLEHAVRKLLSAELAEERNLGRLLKEQGRLITPTLIKYAEPSSYLVSTRENQARAGVQFRKGEPSASSATLVHHDPEAEIKIAAAFLFRASHHPYNELLAHVRKMPEAELRGIIDAALTHLGPHDAPIRELEEAYLTFDLVLDYGAYREFKRHRMQTYIAQPATTALGYVTPPLISESGLSGLYEEAMAASEDAFRILATESTAVASYVVTHAHRRRVLATLNVRECYHLFKLRTQPSAHFSLAEVMRLALEQAVRTHPTLFAHLQLRP